MHPLLVETKAKFHPAMREFLETSRCEALDEAALPAYTHANPLIDRIFWRRLSVAFDEARRHSGRTALDFGCGTGLMSEALTKLGFGVTAVDLDLRPQRLLAERINFSSSTTFLQADLLTLDLATESFDVILALDVLEHVSPLAPYLEVLERVLKQDGVLIISGPTENWLYRVGRKVAGARFTGHYHVSNIRDVARRTREIFDVRTVARIVWPAVLFEVLACRKRTT